MNARKLLATTFFFSFQDKEKFHESLVSAEDIWYRIANQFLVMVVLSFAYGFVMGSYGGVM